MLKRNWESECGNRKPSAAAWGQQKHVVLKSFIHSPTKQQVYVHMGKSSHDKEE